MNKPDLMLPIKQGTPALITVDDWFQAPNGGDYKVIWGRCYYVEGKDAFGFTPKGNANWFVQIGEGDGAILIAGCRIHYAIRCDEKPDGNATGARFYVPKSEL